MELHVLMAVLLVWLLLFGVAQQLLRARSPGPSQRWRWAASPEQLGHYKTQQLPFT
jgi:hypothetical protein